MFILNSLLLLNNVKRHTIVLILSGLASILQNFIFYFTSTYLLPNIYYNSTSGISVPYHLIRVPYSATEASYCATSFTTTLSIYSQDGNISFPGWEYFVPKAGIIVAFHGILRDRHNVEHTSYLVAVED